MKIKLFAHSLFNEANCLMWVVRTALISILLVAVLNVAIP